MSGRLARRLRVRQSPLRMEAFLRNRVTPLIFALLPVLPGGPVIAQSSPAMARLGQLVTACEAAWSGMAAPPAVGSAAGSLAGAPGAAAAATPPAVPALAPTSEAGMQQMAAAQEAQMRALEAAQSGGQTDQVRATLDAVAPSLGVQSRHLVDRIEDESIRL